MKFAFVILNYNVTDETINCIESIKKIDYEGGDKVYHCG
jgi:GT2 family glycosyltransferase